MFMVINSFFVLECAEFFSTIRVDHTRMSHLIKNYFLTMPQKTGV